MLVQRFIEAVLSQSSLRYDLDEDGAFYIFEGLPLPLWISVASGRKFIKLSTYVDIREGSKESHIFEFVNNINAYYFPNSVSYRWGKVWSYFYIPIEIAHTQANLVEIMALTAGNFLAGVRDLDRHDLVM